MQIILKSVSRFVVIPVFQHFYRDLSVVVEIDNNQYETGHRQM